jgi:GNAT superfamily N-acetyltransferase
MKIEIRTARAEHAAAACDVLRRSISECCTEDHRNDEAILAAWLGNKTPETVESWFLSPSNCSLVAIANKEVVGVGMLTRAGKIVLCYVTPELRFTGIGKAMLQAMELQAREWSLAALQVISTATAKSFYQRNGYIPGGTAKCVFGIEATTFSKRLRTGYGQKAPCGCSS